jgi:hypothetical protein
MEINIPVVPIQSSQQFAADGNNDSDHWAPRDKPKKSSTRDSGRETFCFIARRARLRPPPGRTAQNDSVQEREAHD